VSREELLQRGYRISGRVQGVFFRVWTREMAEELGLRGTVRNRPDGSVEAHVLGFREALARFEARLWDGPPAARVEGVVELESREPIPPAPFRILSSAP